MTRIREIVDYLGSVAPYDLQESYDNAGLIVGDTEAICTGVITCLDSTEAVIDEAIQKNANLVVAHHPIIFSGLKRLTGDNYIQRVVAKAIKNDIAILAVHTNLDNVLQSGVNERIANRLGLHSIRILKPKFDEGHIGSGVVGSLAKPMKAIDFLLYLKKAMGAGAVKYTDLCKDEIAKVAVCGGAGGFLLEDAKKEKADIFITSDYKYHEYFDADGAIIIADIGHYESEQYTIQLLQELISQKFSTFAAHCTEVLTNPVKYLS